MNSLVQHFFTPPTTTESFEGFMPQMSLAETDKAYEIDADLPGVSPNEINIEIKGNELWLSGERKQVQEEKGKTFHRIEHRYGRFQRVIPLVSAVDEDKIEADYHDDVLKITLPKAEESKAKRITVKS